MDLRGYAQLLRRRKWIVLEAVVAVAILTGALSSLGPAMYQADALVLLHQGDPSEQVDSSKSVPRPLVDADRYVASQIAVAMSEDVGRTAVEELNHDSTGPSRSPWTIKEVRERLSVRQRGSSDVLIISATHGNPWIASSVSNAVARAYLDNRRRHAIRGLEGARVELQSKLDDLSGQIASLDARIASEAGGGTTQSQLTAARDAASDQYKVLYGRQQELIVEMNLKRGEAELISAAKTPSVPVNRQMLKYGAYGGVLGLVAGIVLAFALEQFDDRLRSVGEVEQKNKRRVLAQLPLEHSLNRGSEVIDVEEQRPQALAEAVRSLRSSLIFGAGERPIKQILITSPCAGEGKSVVAGHLSVAYAQAGFRTVLVLADLRRPAAERLFGIEASQGLAEAITQVSVPQSLPLGVNGWHAAPGTHLQPATNGGVGAPSMKNQPEVLRADLNVLSIQRSLVGGGGVNTYRGVPYGSGPAIAQGVAPDNDGGTSDRRREIREVVLSALVPTKLPLLHLLPSGKTDANPAELLGCTAAAALLQELAALFDVVILDSPPVLAVTDASLLAARVDGVVLVNSLNETRASDAQRAREILEAVNAPVVGVVANKVRQSSRRYGYGYYGREAAQESSRRRRRKQSRQAR